MLKAGLIVPHPALFQNLVSTDLTTHLDAIRTFLGLCFYAKPDTATFERLLENAAMASWDMQSKIQQLNVNAAQGLTKAHVPVLLIYGAHDALVEPRATITRAKELDPNIESKLYSGSGHAPFSDEAKRFNQDIAAFATRVEQLQ